MADITLSESIEITDPKLRKVLLRVAREAEMAIEKVAANFKQPGRFPLPSDQKSLERILQSRFAALHPETQKAAATKALNRIKAPAAVRAARFSDLVRVDLSKPIAVEAQSNALPFPEALKFSASHLTTIANLQVNISGNGGLARQLAIDKLEFRIHKVKCVDETDGFLGSEAGDDEIKLSGVSVDETGETKRIPVFTVGNSFDDGEQKVYSPPKRFTWFDLREGTAFPKAYFVTFILAEADMGGLSGFTLQLYNWVKDRVRETLRAALGTLLGISGGLVGALIAQAVGYVVGLVFDLFKSIWEDDIFRPFTVQFHLPSLDFRWTGGRTDSPEWTLDFRGHGGRYWVTYDLRMFA